MDSTEAQLRFGVSLSSSQTDDLSVSATQYLRHLEERALLTNYFNSANSNSSASGANHVNYAIGTGPFLSSRFGSGIDARRKLTIMQHQHQQFQHMHTSTHQPSVAGQSAVSTSAATATTAGTAPVAAASNSAAQFYQQALSAAVSAVNSTNRSLINAASSSTTANPNQQVSTQQSQTATNEQQSTPGQSLLVNQLTSSQVISSRRDFMSYTLNLMRSYTNEHRDSLPSIDISLLKHIAYAFDGFLFYLRKENDSGGSALADQSDSDDEQDEQEEMSEDSGQLVGYYNHYDDDNSEQKDDDSTDSDDEMTGVDSKQAPERPKDPNTLRLNLRRPCTRSSRFFKRSDSTVCLGGRAPDAFDHSLDESLPLASKPHLLHPHSRIQDMFRVKSNAMRQFGSLNKIGLMYANMRSDVPNLDQSKRPAVKQESKKGQQQVNKSYLKRLESRLVKMSHFSLSQTPRSEDLVDRWRLTADLFGRVFCDDVGLEPGSTIRQLAGFQLKEAKFRREMERLRNMATRELHMEVERDRDSLLHLTFKSLNNMFNVQSSRRAAAVAASSSSSNTTTTTTSSSMSHQSSLLLPPLCLSRIKVTFKDEQGEGSGVARSFYTAFAEAVLADANVNLIDSSAPTSSSAMSSTTSIAPFNIQRYRNIRANLDRRSAGQSNSSTSSPVASLGSNAATTTQQMTSPSGNSNIISPSALNRLLPSTRSPPPTTGNHSANATLNESQLTPTFTSTLNVQLTASAATSPSDDNAPLFWQPDTKLIGFYSPKAGKNSSARLNAFRNVGRVIAICLLQNELCPIVLSRHVIKYMLNRPVRWHDLAFFDSQMYESLRKMVQDAEKILLDAVNKAKSRSLVSKALLEGMSQADELVFKPLDLTFNIDMPEDGSNHDLVENGSQIEVNSTNMYEFVKRYAQFRMVKHVEQCLEQLRAGLNDVLPANAFEGINAEDFRLLLNGVADISINTLASYTTISDESKESNRRAQFEKWFWTTLERMSLQEKQELLFFWTGSPYLPASEEGFQPLPTITLRPASEIGRAHV